MLPILYENPLRCEHRSEPFFPLCVLKCSHLITYLWTILNGNPLRCEHLSEPFFLRLSRGSLIWYMVLHCLFRVITSFYPRTNTSGLEIIECMYKHDMPFSGKLHIVYYGKKTLAFTSQSDVCIKSSASWSAEKNQKRLCNGLV